MRKQPRTRSRLVTPSASGAGSARASDRRSRDSWGSLSLPKVDCSFRFYGCAPRENSDSVYVACPGGRTTNPKALPVLRQRLGGHRVCLGSLPNRFGQTSSGQRGSSRATVDSCLCVSLLSDVPVRGRRRSPAEWRIDLGSNTSSWMRWLINRGGRCVPLRNSVPIWKHDSVVRNKDG